MSTNFPKEIELELISKDIDLVGGSKQDYLLFELSNNEFTRLRVTIIDPKITAKLLFIKDEQSNKKLSKFSTYLNSGMISTAVVIDRIDKKSEFKYIIKFKLYLKKKKDKKIWYNFVYNINYVKYKEIVGNLLCDLFFYGDKIRKIRSQKSEIEELQTEDKKYATDYDIEYEIYKYYNTRLKSISDKLYMIRKLVSILFFLQNYNIFVFDLVSENVAFDTHEDYPIFKLIDYDERLFKFYKRENSYKSFQTSFGQELRISMFNSICFKKQLYLLLKLNDIKEIEKFYEQARSIPFIYHIDPDKDFIIKIYKEFCKRLLNIPKFFPIEEWGNTLDGKVYSYFITNYNLYFDKFNYLFIAEFILYQFYKVENIVESQTEGIVEGAGEGIVEGAGEGIVEGTIEDVSEGIVEGTGEGIVKDTVKGANKSMDKNSVKGTTEETPKTTSTSKNYKFKFDQIMYGNSVGFGENTINFVPYTPLVPIAGKSIIDQLSCFEHLNNIYFLKKLIYGSFDLEDSLYKKPVFEFIDKKGLYNLNYIIFDNVLERGILAPDYEHSSHLILILEFFFSIMDHKDISIFDLHKHNIDSNIGTNFIKQLLSGNYKTLFEQEFKLTNIGTDIIDFCVYIGLLDGTPTIYNLSYKKWCLLSTIEQQMDRWENRTIENIEIPPKNSTLKQNIWVYSDEMGEIKSCNKWVLSGESHKYTESADYIQTKFFPEIVSPEQQFLDKLPLRKYIMTIVKSINENKVYEEFIALTVEQGVDNIHKEYTDDKSSIIKVEQPTKAKLNPRSSVLSYINRDIYMRHKRIQDDVFYPVLLQQSLRQSLRQSLQLEYKFIPRGKVLTTQNSYIEIPEIKDRESSLTMEDLYKLGLKYKYLKYKDKYLKLKLLLNL
jgi:hypothetical protein